MRAKAVAFFAAAPRDAGNMADAATPEMRVRRVICCFIPVSEDDFCRDLHYPAAGCSGNSSKCGARIRVVRSREVGMIQSVEGLPAKFQSSLLAKGNVLE